MNTINNTTETAAAANTSLASTAEIKNPQQPEKTSPEVQASTAAAASPVEKAEIASKKAKGAETKASVVLKKLRSAKGVTVEAIMEATGWQAHSVRGFLSAVVKKKLGLELLSEPGKDGVRRYRIKTEENAT